MHTRSQKQTNKHLQGGRFAFEQLRTRKLAINLDKEVSLLARELITFIYAPA
jgi:hypothetical protein